MAWSTDYTNKMLTGRGTPTCIIRSFTDSVGNTFPGTANGELRLCSVSLATYQRGLDISGVALGTQSLDLRSCTFSGGAWKFAYIPENDTDCAVFLSICVRGTPVQLCTGYLGYAAADYQVRQAGVVSGITRVGGKFIVECWDLLSTLSTTLNLGEYSDTRWTSAGTDVFTGTLTAAFDSLDTSITVSEGASWERETGLKWLMYITPTTGDPFWVTSDTRDATDTANVVFSALEIDLYGTVAVDAVIGDSVTPYALMAGSPIEIALKILCSTGAGTNGSYDTYPQNWGYGIDTAVIDLTDALDWAAVIEVTPGFLLDWLAAESTNGWQDMLTELCKAGVFPAMRMGLLTFRALQDITSGVGANFIQSEWTLNSNDIISATIDLWDDSQPIESVIFRCVATTLDTSALEGLDLVFSYPYQVVTEHNYGTTGIGEPGDMVLWSNAAAVVSAITARVGYWYTRIPERIKARVKQYPFAMVSVGDIVPVDTTLIKGRFLADYMGISAKRFMVVSLRDGFPEPWVDIELVSYAADAADEWDGY